MSKIRIGSIGYEIETVKNLKGEDGTPLHGEVVFGKFKIRLNHRHTRESKFKTTWHETLHLISGLYDLDLDEHKVMILAMAISQVLQDNPRSNWKRR